MKDVSGRTWRQSDLHDWLSHKPLPVEDGSPIPPMGTVAKAFVAFCLVLMLLLTVGGGYYAVGKTGGTSEQASAYGNMDYLDDHSSFDDLVASPDVGDATPYTEPPQIEETPAPNNDNQIVGELTEDSIKISSGEFAYQLDLTVEAGLNITVDLTSSDFGTYLIVLGPNGENLQNDDFEGKLYHSQVNFTAEKEGVYHVLATTSTIGETGGFKLEWTVTE